jgi:hypothetical protein
VPSCVGNSFRSKNSDTRMAGGVHALSLTPLRAVVGNLQDEIAGLNLQDQGTAWATPYGVTLLGLSHVGTCFSVLLS